MEPPDVYPLPYGTLNYGTQGDLPSIRIRAASRPNFSLSEEAFYRFPLVSDTRFKPVRRGVTRQAESEQEVFPD
jgi:hypothetical protein